MPSPFPGMDPFIEAQEWEDFHSRFNLAISDSLQQRLKPAYVVRVERRVYVEHPFDPDDIQSARIADVAVVTSPGNVRTADDRSSATADGIEPVVCTVLDSEERRETYLVLRDSESERVVTVIETLSPSNKRRGGDGWNEYLKKRQQVLDSDSHLVEIDLLRGGAHMPVRAQRSKPVGDYRVMVSRAERRPKVDVYAWPLLQRLPPIPIPLTGRDEQVLLDLQEAFTTVYDRAAYELSLDYAAELSPQLPEPARLLASNVRD